MSYNHNRSPRSTPRDPSTKKHVNQRLFLLAFVLPSTSPLIFLIISKIESILRPASTQIYNWNAFFTTAQWVVFFLVAYAIGIIAGIAGLIYLIGREKKRWHVVSLLTVPIAVILYFTIADVGSQFVRSAKLTQHKEDVRIQKQFDSLCGSVRTIRDTTIESSRFWRRDVPDGVLEKYAEQIARLEGEEEQDRLEAAKIYDSSCQNGPNLTPDEVAKTEAYLSRQGDHERELYNTVKAIVLDTGTREELRAALETERSGDVWGAYEIAPKSIRSYELTCAYPEENTIEENRNNRDGCTLIWVDRITKGKKSTEEMMTLFDKQYSREKDPL